MSVNDRARLSRAAGLATAALAIALASGCQGVDAGCANIDGDYPLVYGGQVMGSGVMQVRRTEGQAVALQLTIESTGEGKIPLTITGRGTCRDGTVRAALDESKNELFTVLGGNAVSVFEPGVIERPFGAWELELREAESGKEYPLRGHWTHYRAEELARELPPPTSAGATPPPSVMARPSPSAEGRELHAAGESER